MKTMLRIGKFSFFLKRNRNNLNGGFTFIEVMTAVAILSFGIVFIYRAFFVSLNYMNHVAYRLHANNILENRITLLQEILRTEKKIPFGQKEETQRVLIDNKPVDFRYAMSFKNMGEFQKMFQLDITVFWKERGRDIKLSRTAYLADLR